MLKRIVVAGLAIATIGVSTGRAQGDGKEAYDATCKKCHGVAGVPPKAMVTKYPKIVAFDAAFFAKNSNDEIVKAITNGKEKGMPSYKTKMTAAQITAVAKYIRTFTGQK